MRARGWLALVAGFGTLVLLIGLMGYGAKRQARALYEEARAAHEAYLRVDGALRVIPAELYLSGILVRDALVDSSPEEAAEYREQLRGRRTAIEERLKVVGERMEKEEPKRMAELRAELGEYWSLMDPVLSWTPLEKAVFGRTFLKEEVLPKRTAVLELAREIRAINEGNLKKERARLEENQARLQSFLRRMVWGGVGVGLVVALVTVGWVVWLERKSEEEKRRAERAEAEMRGLSRRLVRAQEEERRALSRELHDAVGQMLGAMTMELGQVEAAAGDEGRVKERVEEARRLNAETIRGVRDLAMGLRPSMLDELGLGPALRWQGREYSRRSGVPVMVQIDGQVDGLPDTHRTCIYRIVQEALTNCAKHAKAGSVRVALYGEEGQVRLTVQDDGVGFEKREGGLGMLGMEERVRELEGTLTVTSQREKGTILEVVVPVKTGVCAE